MPRIFIALDIPEVIRFQALELQNELKKINTHKVSWIKPSNFHLTLKFLGEIDGPLLNNIINQIEKYPFELQEFQLKFHTPGAFPTLKHPRILIWNIEKESKSLLCLHQQIEKSLRILDIPEDKRSFQPHLTLGRIRKMAGKLNIIEPRVTPAFLIKEFHLYQSILNSSGASYSKIASYPIVKK